MHKFKELVDDSFEELPMGLEEARVLSDDVHDIRRNDGLVVLAALNLTKTQEILDYCDKEALLSLLI
jgi:hypothetical protein